MARPKRIDRGETPSSFWAFSLEVYPREGVEEACLALQDRHGLDVNFLLYLCWLGASGRGRLAQAQIPHLVALTDPWQREVVGALRQIRRRLKHRPTAPACSGALGPVAQSGFREGVILLERAAERIEQELLEGALPLSRRPARAARLRARDAATSVARYFAVLGVKPGPAERGAVAALLRGAFPGLDKPSVEALSGLIRPSSA